MVRPVSLGMCALRGICQDVCPWTCPWMCSRP
jgi:hypothetical protein